MMQRAMAKEAEANREAQAKVSSALPQTQEKLKLHAVIVVLASSKGQVLAFETQPNKKQNLFSH